MDRAEGALAVAEKAMDLARAATAAVAAKQADVEQRAFAKFSIDQNGILHAVYRDGSSDALGSVRADVGPTLSSIEVSEEGSVSFGYSDGRVADAGTIRMPTGKDGRDGRDAPPIPGPAGRSIAKAAINEERHLILTFSDGTTEDAGLSALPGEPGARGADGVGVVSADVDAAGVLRFEMTDGSAHEAGVVRGPAGRDGRNGLDGKDGAAGRDGLQGPAGRDGESPMVEFGSSSPADLSVRDLGRIRIVDVVIDGDTRRILTLD